MTSTRGLLCGLGYAGAVKNPAYTMVESYTLPQFTLHHLDLYRPASLERWEDVGLDELSAPDCACLVEWLQQGDGFTLPADITVSLNHIDGGRVCMLTARIANSQESLGVRLNWPENESLAKRPVSYLS